MAVCYFTQSHQLESGLVLFMSLPSSSHSFFCLNMVVTIVFSEMEGSDFQAHRACLPATKDRKRTGVSVCLCSPLLHSRPFSFVCISALHAQLHYHPLCTSPLSQPLGSWCKIWKSQLDSRHLEATAGCCEVSVNAGVSPNTWGWLELQGG